MSSTTEASNDTKNISDGVWIVPVVGFLSTAEYRKLRRLLHDLGRRNISMRFKYIARLYHSGMLEKIVDLLNETGGKRKRSDDEDEDEDEREALPDPKRKAGDNSETPQSHEEKEDDSAFTDYDSDEGDSSDEDEEEQEPAGIRYTESLYRSLRCARHHASTQTDGSMNSK